MKTTVNRALKVFNSTSSEIDTRTLKYCEYDKNDDWYLQFIKAFYFPMLLKYNRHFCLLWLVVFIIAIIFGPEFLSLTRSDLDVPSDTPIASALKAFKANYPLTPTWPPAFVIIHAERGSVLGYSKAIDTSLSAFVADYPGVIVSKNGYYEYINNPDLRFLAPTSLSANNQTMVFTIHFQDSTNQNDITKTVDELLKFANDQSYPGIKVGCTGIVALFNELAVGSTVAFELIDAVVLPVSLLILGFNLRSYRHILVAIANLGCTLLLALAILVPIAKAVYINPFAPSILLTLGIAVCFDYSLFLLSRFREEVIENKKSKEEAVFICLVASGHVIILSGTTLLLTFLLLIAFPQNFLQSVGYGCSTVIFTAVLSNMSVGPSLLLSFDNLTKFDMCPNFTSCCGCLYRRSRAASTTDQPIDDDFLVIENRYRNEACDNSENNDASNIANAENNNTNNPSNNTDVREKCSEEKKNPVLCPRYYWFRIAYFTTRRPYTTFLIAVAITIPFSMQFAQMRASSDNNLVFLRGSSSLRFLKILATSLPIGAIDPYQILLQTAVAGGVDTKKYFLTEKHLINTLLTEQSTFVEASSITAMSFCQGNFVDFDVSRGYLTEGSPLYNTKSAIEYRVLVQYLRNSDNSATLIQIQTTVDPDSEAIVPFIKRVRATLVGQSANPVASALPVNMYLLGGYCSTYDIQMILYKLYPVMIVSTIVVVLVLIGLNFASIGLPIRLAITIAISLSWTYGILALVYQPGPGQNAFAKLNPVLKSSSGVYYLIPIMSFSVLVGLAMDYDIFLMCRVSEFRKMGWSNRAAVCLAVEKTGNIISAAGLIMSISFAGLLIPTTTVLNQFGFVLFIGVAIDTFIVRTVLVPAAVTAFTLEGSIFKCVKKGKETVADPEDGTAIAPYLNQEPDDNHIQSVWRYKDVDANWWPSMMPRVLLSPMGEHEALWAGYDCPLFYLRDMKGHSEYEIAEDNFANDIIETKDVEIDCILADEDMKDVTRDNVADNELCNAVAATKAAENECL